MWLKNEVEVWEEEEVRIVGRPSHPVSESPRPSSAVPEEGRPSSVAPGAIVPYVPPVSLPVDPHAESVGSAHPSVEAGIAGRIPISSASDSRAPIEVYPPVNVVEPYVPQISEQPAEQGPYIAPGPVPDYSGSFHWSYSIPELSPLPADDHPMVPQPEYYQPYQPVHDPMVIGDDPIVPQPAQYQPVSDQANDFANQMVQQLFAPEYQQPQQQSDPALTEGRISDGRTPFPRVAAAEAGPSQPAPPHIDETAMRLWEQYVPSPIPEGYAYYPQTMVPAIAYQGIFTPNGVCTGCYQTKEHEHGCSFRHIPIHPIPQPACICCDQAGHDILSCPYNQPSGPRLPPRTQQRLPHHPPLPHPDSGRPTEGSLFCAFCGSCKMHWHL